MTSPKMSASHLFQHLLDAQERITYKSAYRAMIGELEGQWRNQKHTSPVLEKAAVASRRDHYGTSIGLDALIVDRESRQPPRAHFELAPYLLSEWRRLFDQWPLCEHQLP